MNITKLLALPIVALAIAATSASAHDGGKTFQLTGKVLGLDAALITGFQMVRIIMTLGLAGWTARWLERVMKRRG